MDKTERNIITLSDVYAGYDKKNIIHGINLEIKEGSCLSILGSNGSGKTTLLRAMCGFINIMGKVMVDGKDLSSLDRKKIASYIAFFSQKPQIYFPYSVYDTVMQGRYMHHGRISAGETKEDREITLETLKSLGLIDIKEESITKLSGGQLQRVMLARCLVQRSPILILDEPMNHLDMKVQSELMEHLEQWRKTPIKMSDGKEYMPTMICVFHETFLASKMADEIAFLKNGRMVLHGEKESVLTDRNLEYVYDFDVSSYMKRMMSE